ncbi:hypothetical protein ANN_01354 [Periplaneta americana]|uniref:Uncharacterized protein n=1 Tax=Periplaneta americana TaxID=6978 RepID=A0ABQ8TV47_PERAM|nr:hypothetical protein ANN_01354 [Periplaneta americana]
MLIGTHQTDIVFIHSQNRKLKRNDANCGSMQYADEMLMVHLGNQQPQQEFDIYFIGNAIRTPPKLAYRSQHFYKRLQEKDCLISTSSGKKVVMKSDKGIIVVTPPYLPDGKLTAEEVETTYSVAIVRIHVESALFVRDCKPKSLPFSADLFSSLARVIDLPLITRAKIGHNAVDEFDVISMYKIIPNLSPEDTTQAGHNDFSEVKTEIALTSLNASSVKWSHTFATRQRTDCNSAIHSSETDRRNWRLPLKRIVCSRDLIKGSGFRCCPPGTMLYISTARYENQATRPKRGIEPRWVRERKGYHETTAVDIPSLNPGDFNAKVGREDIFRPTIGKESLHAISSDNGVRLVNFATSKNLIVKSTTFPHKDIHKYTWTSPDGLTHNQIDHILIDKRRHTSIVDIRTFRDADCNSDHYLVIGELRERLSVAKQVEQQVNITKFNILKLKDEEAKQNYQVEISNRFATLESSDEVEKELDVNSVWENIRDSIKIAAEQSIGYYETKKKKPWFD